ncbi:hypothetical protein [Leucobacter sp. wl10]|uniref:hypothetical protein n=1 Tax=Leucobacter sp. wl10 TaxID=2304677 RepID=UPI001F097453|nr:hypothetical protein [Leucobacter sp. wl10]
MDVTKPDRIPDGGGWRALGNKQSNGSGGSPNQSSATPAAATLAATGRHAAYE